MAYIDSKKLKEEIKNAFVDENQEGIEGITAIGINGGLGMVLQIIERMEKQEGKMHCKTLQKYWNKIPFPDGITLVEAVEIIEKYIEMEGENGI